MEITLLAHPRKTKKKIERDHYYYDPVQKAMMRQRGGRMTFVYDNHQKRLIPKMVDAYGYTKDNSFPDIQKWIERNKNKFDITVNDVVPNYYINIEVNADQWDDISRDLYNSTINYDYDEHQFLAETKNGTQSRNR